MIIFVNPWMFLIWVLASWGIGVLGRDTRFGFIGNFLISFLFSPLVGVIVLLASEHWRRPNRDRKRRRA